RKHLVVRKAGAAVDRGRSEKVGLRGGPGRDDQPGDEECDENGSGTAHRAWLLRISWSMPSTTGLISSMATRGSCCPRMTWVSPATIRSKTARGSPNQLGLTICSNPEVKTWAFMPGFFLSQRSLKSRIEAGTTGVRFSAREKTTAAAGSVVMNLMNAQAPSGLAE